MVAEFGIPGIAFGGVIDHFRRVDADFRVFNTVGLEKFQNGLRGAARAFIERAQIVARILEHNRPGDLVCGHLHFRQPLDDDDALFVGKHR